eukprot:7450109-Heterocapsa_arctica.AAC.1
MPRRKGNAGTLIIVLGRRNTLDTCDSCCMAGATFSGHAVKAMRGQESFPWQAQHFRHAWVI